VKHNHRWLIFIPSSLVPFLLYHLHNNIFGQHAGIFKMRAAILESFYFPNMIKSIRSYTMGCDECQRKKPKNFKAGILKSFESKFPFEHVFCDVLELPRSKDQFSHCLIAIDGFSGYIYAQPIKRLTAENYIKSLIQIFQVSAIPKMLILDEASGFTSREMKSFANRLGFQLNFVSPSAHFSNLCETACKRILHMIKFFADKSLSNWNSVLGMCVAVLNRSHGKTGFSPAQLLFGIQSDYPGSMASFLNDPTSTSEYLRDRIQKRERFIKKRMRLRFWQHAHYNRNRRHIEYSKGQTVFIYFQPRKKGNIPAKLQDKFRRGTLVRKSGPATYLVRLFYRKRLRVRKFHVSLLKPAYKIPDKLKMVYSDDTVLLFDIGPCEL